MSSRSCIETVNRIIAAIPPDAPLRADLEKFVAGVFIELPETSRTLWAEAARIMEKHLSVKATLGDPPPWRDAAEIIWFGTEAAGGDPMTHDTNDAGGGAVDLDAIEARANAATPGVRLVLNNEDAEWRLVAPDPEAAGIEDVEDDWQHIASFYDGNCTFAGHDASFYAHARTDIPALVAEARRLRDFIASLKAKAQQSILITPRHFEAFERGET